MPSMPFNSAGYRETGALRLRQGFLGVVLEKQIEYRDGRLLWRRSPRGAYFLLAKVHKWFTAGRNNPASWDD